VSDATPAPVVAAPVVEATPYNIVAAAAMLPAVQAKILP